MSPRFKLDREEAKCAPSKLSEYETTGTCLTLPLLLALTTAFNEHVSQGAAQQRPIAPFPITSFLGRSNASVLDHKRYLLEQLTDRLKQECDDELCWMDQPFVDRLSSQVQDELRNDTFRPLGPQGQFTWLSTVDLNRVMKQYERKFTDFRYLGALPMDFDELPALGIRNLDFTSLQRGGKKKVGAIFNLDEHNKPGSHWVSLFANLDTRQMYFFDSYGVKPDRRVRALMDRIEKAIGPMDKGVNDYRHQYGDSECGLYSLAFILRFLVHDTPTSVRDTFTKLSSKRIPDSYVNSLRRHLFRFK